jgi:excisionase family DNA binding protein
MNDISRALYPLAEVWDRLGVHKATGYRLIGRGQLDAVKIGSRTYVTAESLARFLAELPRAQIRYGRKPKSEAAGGRRVRMERSPLLNPPEPAKAARDRREMRRRAPAPAG